jgi:Ala-tRNA(Pro) deacylase
MSISYIRGIMDKQHSYNPMTLLDYLRDSGVDHRVYTHEPVFTVAEAERVSGEILGTHTRNLFLRDKKETMFLVTLRHDTRVDLKKLAGVLGAGKLSFGSPERLWTYLGVTPGSVTPLAILNDSEKRVQLVLEKGMMAEDLVNFHPLINSMTVGMTPTGLMTLLEKHAMTPQILDLSLAAPDNE